MIFNVNSGAGKQPVNIVPSTNSSFTYDGSAKTPLWQNYDTEQLTISGADSATNAGTYKVYFTPKSDYEWWDGTTTPKEVTWSIAKAAGSLSLSASSGTIYGKNSGTATFTVTRAGDGQISVSSSNTGIATVSVSGTTVTVKSVAYGTSTITVSVAEGTNHTAPSNKTYAVTVSVLYLYNAGNENTAITGGWTTAGKAMGNWEGAKNVGTPELSKGNSSMSFSSKYNATGSILYCKNKINLTNFTTLKFSGSLMNRTNESWCILATWSNVPTYWWDQKGTYVSLYGSGSATKSVNVTNLSGSYVVGIGTYGGLDNDLGSVKVTVNKVWLE